MTLEGLHALARERFGPNASDWKFVCPQCGHIAAVGDFPPEARQSAGQNCLGRYVEGVGCKHAAYGLITQAPWTIATADGDNMRFFALAEAEPADELMNQLS